MNQKEAATHATTHASPRNITTTDINDTCKSEHVNAAGSPETYHVFETKSSARVFRALMGEDHNIANSGIGWRVEPMFPVGVTVYLWPERLDSTGFKWIADCAATSKATLRLPIPPKMGAPLFGYIRDCASPTGLLETLDEAESVVGGEVTR